MKRQKIIKMKQAKLVMLMKRTGKSRSSVYAALRFATDGEEPERIRSLAVKEYGGVETTVTRV